VADCLFCKIVAGELAATIVAESELALAFADINPATPGHTLVIPRAHAQDVQDVTASDLRATTELAQQVARAAFERLGADGVNLLNSSGALAGQTVFHFHIHVIPRYDGDSMRPSWVPSPGDPDQIAAAAAALRGA